MSRTLVLIFAVACGLSVANLYYAQPLLALVARVLHGSVEDVGLVVTATQIGYATGLLLLVPLADLLDRRRLIVTVLCGTTAALGGAALAPTVWWLAVALLAVGMTSVVAQILVPFAASLAGDGERGRVVGTVMSGLLIGILAARTVAGLVTQAAATLVGEATAWRAIYVLAACLMIGQTIVLGRVLPRRAPAVHLSYGALLRSVGGLVRSEPLLRRRATYGGLVFAAFSTLWTSLAFLLSRPPYGYGQAVIGLFGLLGLVGAITASAAGRLADRGVSRPATLGFLCCALASFGLLALGSRLLPALAAGIVVLDLGVQGVHILNQSAIYTLRPEARGRLTTAYMTTYFVGGAIGSAVSTITYSHFGWTGVCLTGAIFCAAALALWPGEPEQRTAPP